MTLSNLKAVAIPGGTAAKIEWGGHVLWKRAEDLACTPVISMACENVHVNGKYWQANCTAVIAGIDGSLIRSVDSLKLQRLSDSSGTWVNKLHFNKVALTETGENIWEYSGDLILGTNSWTIGGDGGTFRILATLNYTDLAGANQTMTAEMAWESPWA